MRRTEIVATLVFLMLGIHVVQQATLLPYTEKYGPGPGFIPFWLGCGWIVLTLLHLGNIAMQPSLYRGSQPFPGHEGLLRVGLVYGIVLCTVFLLGKLGLPLSLALMVLAILLLLERSPWKSSAVASIAISVLLYLVFAVLLGVPFPRGPLGI